MWAWAGAAGIGVMITGLVSVDGAQGVLGRLLPVMIFLVAVTLLAELSDAAGLFAEAAHRASLLARVVWSSSSRLWRRWQPGRPSC